MAIPTTRDTFKAFCLRRLGAPGIEVNVTEEQVDDCVDVALIRFWDFHFDGSEKTYYKHQITANNYPDRIYKLTINTGGTGYSNTDVITFTEAEGLVANASLTTDANGKIISTTFTDNGRGFSIAPTATIVTSGGTGADIEAELGGFVPVPPEILSVVNIFDVGMAESGVNSIFNIRYQIALNDLYQLNNLWLPDYYIIRQNVALIEEVLVGKQPIRFNKYTDRMSLDMAWDAVPIGSWLILEAYRRISPDDFAEVWSDSWLQRYTVCLIKEQWGYIMKKYTLPFVSGTTFNGQMFYDEAIQEKDKLEYELYNTWSAPIMGMYG